MADYLWLSKVNNVSDIFASGLLCGTRSSNVDDYYASGNYYSKIAYFLSANPDGANVYGRLVVSNTLNAILYYGLRNNVSGNTRTEVYHQAVSYGNLYTFQSPVTTNGVWASIPDNVIIHNSITEAYKAMNDGNWDGPPAPIVNPGVHVQFHPVYIPSFPGVHVQFNPVNLNPYEPGGESEPGGGGGDYDNPTEIISLPSLPTITVEPFINLWAPQPTDMQLLANYLFSDNLWDSVTRQLFGNPIQYIVSLGIVPVPIVSQESTKETFKLATQVSDFQMYKVNSQYKEFICGTVNVPPYWGSFMDYEPHTKIQIYLPFIGFRSLSPSEVVGKSLTVVYHIDVFSGSLVAFIQSNGNLLYQFTGNCLTQMPFAASEYVNAFSGTIGALTGIGTGLIGLSGAFGAGAGALMAIGGFSSAFSSAVTVNKEQVQHGADVTSSFGLLSSRKPYLILNRPKQAIAERQNEYHGYATWYRANDFLFAKGFTKLAQIHLEGIPATDWEIQEIERLLKEGVIF